MGFKRERKTYRLVFDNKSELDGLEVVTKSMPLRDFMEMAQLANSANESSEEGLYKANNLFVKFSEFLVEWNLEDEDGKPVPADFDGVYSQELAFVLALVTAWMEAISGVSNPLGKESTSGGQSLAGSIPMETL